MRAENFDYDLPRSAIADRGVEPRDSARLLVVGSDSEHTVADLDQILRSGDVLVVNDTRVLPARIRFRRPTGGASEVLLLNAVEGGWWECLVKPSAKMAPGLVAEVAEGFTLELGEHLEDGLRLVRPSSDGEVVFGERLLELLEAHGEMPLPPYLGDDPLEEPDRYQTVFARRAASAAAPTAGLHLTSQLLARLASDGVEIVTVELVVGLGTFRPMTADLVEDHVMHHEMYVVSESSWATVQRAKEEGRRVVAVGTTVVRALESAAVTKQLSGSTNLFISRPYPWAVVDVLMTNFHLPRSTLLVMIDAFMGPQWREVYREALASGYRFLSFGDAMLVERESEVRQ